MAHPYDSASWFSRCLMLWAWPITLSRKRRIASSYKLQDLPKVADLSKNLIELESSWVIEKTKLRPSFLRAALSQFRGKTLSLLCSIQLVQFCNIAVAVLVTQLVTWLRNPSAPLWLGFFLASLFLLSAGTASVLQNKTQMEVTFLGGALIQSATCLLHKKLQRLPLSAESVTGQILSVVAADLDKFDNLTPLLVLCSLPLCVIVMGGLLYQQLGVAGLLALAITIAQFLVLKTGTKCVLWLRTKAAEAADARIMLLQNVIEGAKVAKMYAWEDSLISMLNHARVSESRYIFKRLLLRAINLTVANSGHAVTLLFTVWLISSSGEQLDLAKILGAVTLISSLQFSLCYTGSEAVDLLAVLTVASQRISALLLMPEVSEKSTETPNDFKCAIEVSEMAASWAEKETEFTTRSQESLLVEEIVPTTISNCSFKINDGELCFVVGAVGCGKSSLLLTLLGELFVTQGKVRTRGKLAYVEQQPWLLPASIRENIIMQNEFEARQYRRTVEACSLARDFAEMSEGDATIVSCNGTNLSGGQQARIALARAVYRDADCYLLDDPLSAVDSHVRSQLFENCICGVLAKKTRILVTHHTQLLNRADKIIMMDAGRVAAVGNFEEISKDERFREMFSDKMKGECPPSVPRRVSVLLQGSDQAHEPVLPFPLEPPITANVSFRDYWRHFNSAYKSIGIILLTLLLCVLGGVSTLAITLWLQYWASQSDQSHSYFMSVLAVIACLMLLLGFKRSAIVSLVLQKTGEKAYNTAVDSVMRARSTFFDENPSGKIMNRFTRDTETMTVLSWMESLFLMKLFALITYVATIVALNPYALAPTFVLAILLWMLMRILLPRLMRLRKLFLVQQSAIFTQLNSTARGLAVARGNDCMDLLQSRMEHIQINVSQSNFTYHTTGIFLQTYSDFCALLLNIANAFLIVGLKSNLDSSLIGSSLTFTVSMLSLIPWLCKAGVEIQCMMASVQRVQEYATEPVEGAYRLTPFHPTRGDLTFEDVKLRYREDLEHVLCGFSCVIPAGTWVGIIGRTGAGKSSIIQALFRLVPISSGRILLDDVDISTVGLHDLRSCLAVIPQTPFIFRGTLRVNLDPTGQTGDEELWDALRQVELTDCFIDGLDTEMGSMTLSVGQKQLLCMSRAILRHSKVLVMDEATANIDIAGEELIHETLRRIFSTHTVLTIAHRLKTVMEYQTIVVVAEGICKEFGTPQELAKGNGYFARMVAQEREEQ